MGKRWAILLSAALVFGGCGPASGGGEPSGTSGAHPIGKLFEEAEPFDFRRGEVVRVTVYTPGAEKVVAVASGAEDLNELGDILHRARPAAGEAAADWNYTIVIEGRDGAERRLEVTGVGTVFVDESSEQRYAYVLDKKKFQAFLEKKRGT
ncbi:hypothetical protein [Paenibacillus sp.]|uniref:hypothetical protein n=1 Tax=Paenibacillus sp. TaxID=58172 RepID=UPI002D2E8923|nr:hypothetical protein [Paenibacillus sp.]HZG85601.1 hypothetical protein [Paenibacillus sp.]